MGEQTVGQGRFYCHISGVFNKCIYRVIALDFYVIWLKDDTYAIVLKALICFKEIFGDG